MSKFLSTDCPRSSDPFYVVISSNSLYKMGTILLGQTVVAYYLNWSRLLGHSHEKMVI